MVDYKELIEGYLLNNFIEQDRLEQILNHLREENEDKLIDRKNFIGHFTASAFVIAKKSKKILMLHHKVLRKYLQPGGHIEKTDINPLQAAKRELSEETGIDSETLFYKCIEPLDELIPFNISVHKIPENKSKNEKSHYHYDLQYLFFTEDEIPVTINELESSSFEWIEWENFRNMIGYKNIAKKIELIQSSGYRTQESFLSKIVSQCKFEDISCVAVQHIIPSSIPLIKTLKKIFGDRLLVCAKPNSVNQEVWNELKGLGVRIKIASRDDKFDENFCEITSRTVLIDIGGYFVNIAQKRNIPIICIVEDTENGIKKYEQNLLNTNYPIFSVARNPLKRNEDYLVGMDIVFGADYILHQKNLLIKYMNVACIGYGKIGYGICSRLREIGIKPKVIEKDHIRSVKAVRDGCEILINRDLSDVDIVFCATGSKCLDILDFRSLKDGAFVVTATSSDDEFDLNYINGEYSINNKGDYFTEYKNEDNYFYVLNQGIPANFAVNSALGNYILLVHAAILFILQKVVKFEGGDNLHSIYSLSETDNQYIAQLWLEHFNK